MLRKLGRTSRGAIVKVEYMQGAVSVARQHCIAVPPCCHACGVTDIRMVVEGQRFVSLQYTQLDLQRNVQSRRYGMLKL